MSKILYVASTISHIKSFHLDYIERLRAEGHAVFTMARGEEADFDIPFEKKIFSRGNTKCKKLIKDILSREKFDIIILNTSLAAYHLRRCLSGNRAKRPRVVNIVHGYLFPKHARSLGERARAFLLLFAERLCKRATDEIIVMNAEDLEIAKKHKLALEGVRFINGMGVKIKEASIPPEKIREELGVGKDTTLISFVGELSSRKNQALLISAMPKLLSQGDYALLLVGEGDKRQELEELAQSLSISDRVHIIGRRDNAMDYMRASDIYASAAKSEGLPFNVVEALALGLPTVASRVKGHTDIIKNEARLFDKNDSDELASAILSLEKSDGSAERACAEVYLFENAFEQTYNTVKEAAGLLD